MDWPTVIVTADILCLRWIKKVIPTPQETYAESVELDNTAELISGNPWELLSHSRTIRVFISTSGGKYSVKFTPLTN